MNVQSQGILVTKLVRKENEVNNKHNNKDFSENSSLANLGRK